MASFLQGYEAGFICLLTDICNINIQGVSLGPQLMQSPHKTEGFFGLHADAKREIAVTRLSRHCLSFPV